MSSARTATVVVRFKVSTNLPDVDLTELFGSWGEATWVALLEGWAGSGVEGGYYVLERAATPEVLVVRPQPTAEREHSDARLEALGDSVDEELEYHRWEAEQELAAFEALRAEPSYELEDDPRHGETSAGYEEGRMP